MKGTWNFALICAIMHTQSVAMDILKDPNNLFTVFDEQHTKDEDLNSAHLAPGISPKECPEKCNLNLTKALAAQVMHSMSKFRPGDAVRTSISFYLSWDDASKIRNFVNSFSDSEFVTQALAEKIESALSCDVSNLNRRSTSTQTESLISSDFLKNVIMVTSLFTFICCIRKFIFPDMTMHELFIILILVSSSLTFFMRYQYFYQTIMVIVALVSTLLILLRGRVFHYLSFKKLLGLLAVIPCIISFTMQYIHLYQVEIAKRESLMAQIGHQLPSHCSPHSQTWSDSISLFFGRKSSKECEEYFKHFHLNSAFVINPLNVFASTCKKLLTPLLALYLETVEKIVSQTCGDPSILGILGLPFRLFVTIFLHLSFFSVFITTIYIFCGGQANLNMFYGFFSWKFLGRSREAPRKNEDNVNNANAGSIPDLTKLSGGYVHTQHITYHNYAPNADQHPHLLHHARSAPNLYEGRLSILNDKRKSKKSLIEERKKMLKLKKAFKKKLTHMHQD